MSCVFHVACVVYWSLVGVCGLLCVVIGACLKCVVCRLLLFVDCSLVAVCCLMCVAFCMRFVVDGALCAGCWLLVVGGCLLLVVCRCIVVVRGSLFVV